MISEQDDLDLNEPTISMSAQEFLQRYELVVVRVSAGYAKQRAEIRSLAEAGELEIRQYSDDLWHDGYLRQEWHNFLEVWGPNYFLMGKWFKPPYSAWRRWRLYTLEYMNKDDFFARSKWVRERQEELELRLIEAQQKAYAAWSAQALDYLDMVVKYAAENATCQVNIPITMLSVLKILQQGDLPC
jgi:hypothetical protein